MEKTRQHARDVFTLTAHSDAEAADLAEFLLDRSQYFAAIPLPDDDWAIEVTEIPAGVWDVRKGVGVLQTYRMVCDHCEDIADDTVNVGDEFEMVALVLRSYCGHARTAFAVPQRTDECNAYYSQKHPAAAAEAKAIAGQLAAGVEAVEAKMIGRKQCRKLPKPCGCRLNMTCDVCRPPTVVPVDPDPDAGLFGTDFRPPRSLPEHMRRAVTDYVERGAPIGSFLTAVLSNDFVAAHTRADHENRAAIDEWIEFLRAFAPDLCWGSLEKVEAWQQRGGLKGGR